MPADSTLTQRFIDAATRCHDRAMEEERAADIEHYAQGAVNFMQAAALSGQYERLYPRTERQEDEALAAYRALALDLQAQFRGGGTATSLRIADRIKRVIDEHG